MPKDQSKIIILLSLLAQLKESTLAGLRVEKVDDEGIDLAFFIDSKRSVGGVGTGKKDGLVGDRMGQGQDRVDRSVGVRLDAALVRIILQTVLHVRDGLRRDEPRHGVMRSSKHSSSARSRLGADMVEVEE